jgi:hypothetical protein
MDTSVTGTAAVPARVANAPDQEFGLDGTHGSPTPGGSARIGMEDIPTPKALPGKILGHHHPWCAESVTPLDRPRPHGGSCTPHAA